MLSSRALGDTVPIWMNESGTGEVFQFAQSVSQRWCVSRMIGLRSHSSGSGIESEIQPEQATRTASQLALSCGFSSRNLSTRHAPYIPFSRRKANASPTDGSFFLVAIRVCHFFCEQVIQWTLGIARICLATVKCDRVLCLLVFLGCVRYLRNTAISAARIVAASVSEQTKGDIRSTRSRSLQFSKTPKVIEKIDRNCFCA